MKKCPSCAREIQDEAVNCQFCREVVNTKLAASKDPLRESYLHSALIGWLRSQGKTEEIEIVQSLYSQGKKEESLAFGNETLSAHKDELAAAYKRVELLISQGKYTEVGAVTLLEPAPQSKSPPQPPSKPTLDKSSVVAAVAKIRMLQADGKGPEALALANQVKEKVSIAGNQIEFDEELASVNSIIGGCAVDEISKDASHNIRRPPPAGANAAIGGEISTIQFVGILVMLFGAVFVVFTLKMNVSVDTPSGLVSNIGLLNDRTIYMMLTCTSLLIGTLMLLLGGQRKN